MINNEKEKFNTEMLVFEYEDFNSLKQIEKSCGYYMGFVYILEWNDMVKIGCTQNPYKRLLALKKQAEQYGNIKLGKFALSKEHTNYRDNETMMHHHFKEFRKNGTELFNVSFQKAIEEFSNCAKLLDESEKFLKKAEAFQQFAIDFAMGNVQKYIKNESSNITNNYIEEKPKRSTSKKYRKGDTKFMDENQKDFLRSQLEDYLQRNGVDTTKPMFRCLICGSSDACHIVPNTNRKLWKCFSANHSKYTKNTGDIFEYAMQLNNVDFSNACEILKDMYLQGHITETPKVRPIIKSNDKEMEDFVAKQIPLDISLAIEHADENREYLLKRGISVETQKRYNIGFINGYVHPKQIYEYNKGIRNKVYPTARVIIPTSDSSYLARAIHPQDEGENSKFKVLKAGETHVFNADILKENIGYCFCFEGEIDALSGIECGCNSIGLGSTSMIPKLFKDYPINPENVLIIAMDNDEGGKNSIAKFETLAKANKIPYIVVDSNVLFNGAKDCNQALQNDRNALIQNLETYKNQALKLDKQSYFNSLKNNTDYSHTKRELPKYIMQKKKYNRRLECDEIIYSISTQYLADYIREHSHYIFVQDNAMNSVNRYWYQDGVYKLVNDDTIKGIIKSFIEPYKDLSPTLLRRKDIIEVFSDLTTDLKYINHEQLNANENIINFKNGLLNLTTMELMPHTPDVYSTIQIPCNYNPKNTNAPNFNQYLNTLTENNDAKKLLLLEFIGVAISNIHGYRLKKSLFMTGKGDTGKSQAKILTERLIGLENCSGIDLGELEERFGTSNLYNKRLIGSSDMSFMSIKELKVFKKITGGDSLFIEFKGQNGFNYVYNGLSWFCMNKLPKFSGDKGKWVYDRMIIFQCNNVVPKDKQDKELCDKMFAEREAIINMLIPAIKKVISNNYELDIPLDCIAENQEYQKNNNVVRLFLDECTEPRQRKDNCTTKVIYDVFKRWCMDNNNGYCLNKLDFRQELCELFSIKDIKAIEKKIRGVRYYNFTLTYEAKLEFNVYDSIDDINNNYLIA